MNPKVYFSTKQYLTKKEQEAIDKFCENQPVLDGEYKSGDKTWKPMKFDFPNGAKTPETKIVYRNEEDDTYRYITPHTEYNDTKSVRVWVSDGEKQFIVTSGEWFKFVNGKDSSFVKPPSKKAGAVSGKTHAELSEELAIAKQRGDFERPVDFASNTVKGTDKGEEQK